MNTGTLLTKSARAYPQNLAVACGPGRWTHALFNERVNRLSHAFGRLGVRRGRSERRLQGRQEPHKDAELGRQGEPGDLRIRPDPNGVLFRSGALSSHACRSNCNACRGDLP